MTGLVVLAVALLATVALGVAYSRRNGRFVERRATADARERLDAATIGAPLGQRATLVQFSSSFCSPCRATRVLLTDVASRLDGVEAVEIDAESHLDLVRRLDVMRTPTVFVLDRDGTVTTRASGLPRREQVLAALGVAVDQPN